MKKLLSILLTLLSFSLLAQAQGTNSGGGGIGVVCYQDGIISKVELLDTYEGKAKGLTFAELSGEFDEDVKSLTRKIHGTEYMYYEFLESFKRVKASLKKIPSDSELELTNDALPAFLPKGCKFKQIANYYNDGL